MRLPCACVSMRMRCSCACACAYLFRFSRLSFLSRQPSRSPLPLPLPLPLYLIATMPHKALDILGYSVISPLPSPKDEPASSPSTPQQEITMKKWITANANLVLKLEKPCIVRIFVYLKTLVIIIHNHL